MTTLESLQAYATNNNEYPGACRTEDKVQCPECLSTEVYASPMGTFEECVDCGHTAKEEQDDV